MYLSKALQPILGRLPRWPDDTAGRYSPLSPTDLVDRQIPCEPYAILEDVSLDCSQPRILLPKELNTVRHASQPVRLIHMSQIPASSNGGPRFPFLDFYVNGLHPVKEHKGWYIYRFRSAYHTSDGWADLYVGYKPERSLIEGLGAQAVLSEIDEAEQRPNLSLGGTEREA